MIKKITTLLLTLVLSDVVFSERDFAKLIQQINKKNAIQVISTTQLNKNLNNYTLLDAREPKEYKVSHIKSALNVGYKNFDLDKTIKKLTKDRPIVIYCSLGVRSGKIAKKLRAKGYEVYNLSGGIFAWFNQGMPVVKNDGTPSKMVHGYNKSWSKWVLDKTKVTY